MCYPASFIVTKTKVFWSENTESHEDIIKEFGLVESGAKGVNLVRVEIVPEKFDYLLPLSAWEYKVDQDILPEWYNAEKVEQRCRKHLGSWASKKLVIEGTREIRQGQIIVAGKAKAILYGSSRAVLCDSSSAVLYDSSSAVLCDSSSAVLYDSSSAVLYDSSRAVLWDSSRAVLCGSSSASAVLHGSSSAVLHGSSSAVLYDSSRANLYDSSSANLYDSSSAVLYDSSRADAKTDKAVLIDRRTSKVQAYVGPKVLN